LCKRNKFSYSIACIRAAESVPDFSLAPPRDDLDKAFGKVDAGFTHRCGKAGERCLLELGTDCSRDLLIPIARVGYRPTGHKVQIGATVGVPNPTSLSPLYDERKKADLQRLAENESVALYEILRGFHSVSRKKESRLVASPLPIDHVEIARLRRSIRVSVIFSM